MQVKISRMKVVFLFNFLVLAGVIGVPVESPEQRVSFSTATSFSFMITTLPNVVQPGLFSLSQPIFQTSDYTFQSTFWNNWNNFFQNINIGYTQGSLINGALSQWGWVGGTTIFRAFNEIITVLTRSLEAVGRVDTGVASEFNLVFLRLKDYIATTNRTIARAVNLWPLAIISTQLNDQAYSNLTYILQTSAQLINNMSLFWSNSSANNVYVPFCYDYTFNPMYNTIMLQMNKSFDLYYDFTNTSLLYLGDTNKTLQGIQWSLDYQFSLRFNNLLSVFVHIVRNCEPVTTSTEATTIPPTTTVPSTTTTTVPTTTTPTPTTTIAPTSTNAPTTTTTIAPTTTIGPTEPTTTGTGPTPTTTTTTPTTTTTTTPTTTTTTPTTTTTTRTTTTTTPTTTTTTPTTTAAASNCRLCAATDYQCQMTGCKFTNNGKLIGCIPWCQSDWTGPNQPKTTGATKRSLWGLEIYPYNCTWSIYLATNSLDMLKVEVAKNWTLILGGYQNYFKIANNNYFTSLMNAFSFARNVFVNVIADSCIKGGPCYNTTIQKHLDISMEAQSQYMSCLTFAANSLDQFNKWIYQAIDYKYNELQIQIANCTNADGTINDRCITVTIDPTWSDLKGWIANIMMKLSVTSDVGYTLGQCIAYSNQKVFDKIRTLQIEFNSCAAKSWFTV